MALMAIVAFGYESVNKLSFGLSPGGDWCPFERIKEEPQYYHFKWLLTF